MARDKACHSGGLPDTYTSTGEPILRTARRRFIALEDTSAESRGRPWMFGGELVEKQLACNGDGGVP